MILKDSYPTLANLIGGYLHQDFDINGETVVAVVETALNEENPGYAERLRKDVEDVLASAATESELARWFDTVGLEVLLEPDGFTPRSFLAMVVERIDARTNTTSAR
jgi:hypothetical protein